MSITQPQGHRLGHPPMCVIGGRSAARIHQILSRSRRSTRPQASIISSLKAQDDRSYSSTGLHKKMQRQLQCRLGRTTTAPSVKKLTFLDNKRIQT
jgi:hypothetical protein